MLKIRASLSIVRNDLGDNAVEVESDDSQIGRVLQMLHEEGDSRALGHGEIFDTEPYRYTGGREKGYDTWLNSQEEQIPVNIPAREFGPNPLIQSP